jgi:hypothetical protein
MEPIQVLLTFVELVFHRTRTNPIEQMVHYNVVKMIYIVDDVCSFQLEYEH